MLGRTGTGDLVAVRVSADGATARPNPLELLLPSDGATTITGAPRGMRPVLSTRGGRLASFNADLKARGYAPTYPG